jgi:hypothetical protein
VTPGLAYDLLAVKYGQHTGYLQCILFCCREGGREGGRDVKLYLVRAVPVLNSDERVSGIIALVCPTRAELSRRPDSYSSTASTTVANGLAHGEAEASARWRARSSALWSPQSPACCSEVRDAPPRLCASTDTCLLVLLQNFFLCIFKMNS